ncbi:MAG: hypothetical protein U0270_04295 [Labilithrix sp.]
MPTTNSSPERPREQLLKSSSALAAAMVLSFCRLATADDARPAPPAAEAPRHVNRIEMKGIDRTRESTLLGVLPRPLPTTFTPEELEEYERRVNNLAIFDLVTIAIEDDVLVVDVREKWTLTPLIDFASGETLKDTYALLGASEDNFLGRALQLGLEGSYLERSWNGEVWAEDHPYRTSALGFELGGGSLGSSFRFDDSESEWQRRRSGGHLAVKLPNAYGSFLRYEVGIAGYREAVLDRVGVTPASGTYLHAIGRATLDRYLWNDLVPRGNRVIAEVGPGFFFGPSEQRHYVRLRYLGALALGKTTVVMANVVGDLLNAGNPNHSALLGTISGVRGLPDTFYRSNAQAYLNLELRQSFRIATRWAIQVVALTDAAVLRQLDAAGEPTKVIPAVSFGGGGRIIPTLLSDTLLRVDTAVLALPHRGSVIQVGLSQYF